MATKAIFILLSSFPLFFFSNFSVQARINGGPAYAAAQVGGNPCWWAPDWDPSSLTGGEQTHEARASTDPRAGGNFIGVSVKTRELPRVHTRLMIAGKYQSKRKVRTFVSTNDFKQGSPVIFRIKVADADSGLPVANATAEIFISGPQSTLVVTGPSDMDGMAEAKWRTSAPNKRKWNTSKGGAGGTQTGSYTGTLAKLSASGYLWDGESRMVNFNVLLK